MSAPLPSRDSRREEFFVGYLPPPAGVSRFMRRICVALLFACAIAGSVLPLYQRDPGAGSWDAANVQSFEGILTVDPFPMIRLAPGHVLRNPDRACLITESGKLGARRRCEPFAHRGVRLRGTIMQREGYALIELAPGDDAIVALDEPGAHLHDDPLLSPPPHPPVTTAIRGQIIDPKCFLGAMKPGEGKPHRACAALCLAGGIPPLLAARLPDDAHELFLLVGPDRQPLSAAFVPFAGDGVELRGVVFRLYGWNVVACDPDSIRRLESGADRGYLPSQHPRRDSNARPAL